MKPLIAFAILLAIGFLGSVKLFHRLKVSSPFSYLFYSGTFFIFFGLLIGENGLNLISREIVHHLEPLIHFSLGWVGFLFGFQLEYKFLKRIQWNWWFSMVATYLVSFVAVFFITFFAIRLFSGGLSQDLGVTVGFSLVLATIIPESSVTFVVWSSKFFEKHIQQLRLCSFIAASDNFFPILVTGILFSFYRYLPGTNSIAQIAVGKSVISFGIQLVIGILAGVLLHYLLKRIEEKLEISAVLLGVIFFISGLSLMSNFSPLFVAMVTGTVFSNLTRRHSYLVKIMAPTEKPIYLIFLVFLTVHKAVLTWDLLLLALGLLAAKFFTKGIVFGAMGKVKKLNLDTSPYLSYLLLPLSAIAPAILLDLFIAFPDENTRKIVGIFIISQVFLEVLAPAAIKITQKRLETKEDDA